MDGTEYIEELKGITCNMSCGNQWHLLARTEPNGLRWLQTCANVSCQSSRALGYSYSTVELLLITAVTASLSIVTVLGNILVMISIKVNRRLWTFNNYFLFSLACADLITGIVSMNLYTMYILKGYWPLGAVVCDLWLTLDYVVSNASVMNLLIISFDRYFCVTRPLTYPARRTGRLAALMISGAWLLSLLLWAPAILCWQMLTGKRIVPDGDCFIQLLSSPVITLGTIFPSFFLPAAIMIVLYTRISLAGRERLTELRSCYGRTGTSSGSMNQRFFKRKSSVPVRLKEARANSGSVKLHMPFSKTPKIGIDPEKRSSKRFKASERPSERTYMTNLRWPTDPNPNAQPPVQQKDENTTPLNTSNSFNSQKHQTFYTISNLSQCGEKRMRRKIARENKVTKTIFAILLVFILTWTPYSVMTIIGTYCRLCVPDTLWSIGYWLCYINSTINPFCYALCNVIFRKTFKNLLRCRYKNIHGK